MKPDRTEISERLKLLVDSWKQEMVVAAERVRCFPADDPIAIGLGSRINVLASVISQVENLPYWE